LNQWKIYCETEGAWKQWVLPVDDEAPTTCPKDTAHSVSAGSVSIDKTIGQEAARTPEGMLYTIPHPSSLSYEMCDRDILIRTATHDSRAMILIDGADVDGNLLYVATAPGERGNSFTVEHSAGATGAGNENRALSITLTRGLTWDLTITFGTNGSGGTVYPSANEVAGAILGDSSIVYYISAQPTGTGLGLLEVAAKSALAGGASLSLDDVKIDPITFQKGEWNEVQQIGVFKLEGGNYVECADQADATVNAVLSVWRYQPHCPNTGELIGAEIRDGFLIVDETITDSYEHQAYAVAAPHVPGSVGGAVVQFDAYLRFYKGKQLGATSPQAKALDPNTAAGPAGAELRICIYYPQGTQNNHVLRLVTYRPPERSDGFERLTGWS
jgi:hypothetical protein